VALGSGIYNTLLNLDFGKRTFSDDLLIAMRAENVREAENFANIEVNKIKWAEENQITFSEQKSTVMVVTRRKRKESTDVYIYILVFLLRPNFK
jgi:hypothetical protein